MVSFYIVLFVLILFLIINYRVRKTNAYRNFYRAIHVVKDIKSDNRYRFAAFGSTFSYYAYDLKEYSGHNFSVEPQSIRYMEKVVKHFANNIDKGGIAFLSLAGCFFAASSTTSDEECLTYQAFLRPDEFDKFSQKTKIKYFLKRYLPALSPYYVKCILKDEPAKYAINRGPSHEIAIKQAKNRIKGWERVVGKPIGEDFLVDPELQTRIDSNIEAMRRIVGYLRNRNIVPVFVILPMSNAFNEVCPKKFYDEILYKSIESLKNEEVLTLDYLYDKDLGNESYYYIADCLNMDGRKQFTKKLMSEIDFLLGKDRKTIR